MNDFATPVGTKPDWLPYECWVGIEGRQDPHRKCDITDGFLRTCCAHHPRWDEVRRLYVPGAKGVYSAPIRRAMERMLGIAPRAKAAKDDDTDSNAR